MKEKIDLINKLEDEINELDDFIKSLKKGNTVSEFSEKNDQKKDTFSCLSLEAMFWTGRDKCRYEKSIKTESTINKLKNAILVILEQELEIKQLKLQQLIN